MRKIKSFVAAAALVSIPMLSLDAAPLTVPQSAAPVMSETRPTTADSICFWWSNGVNWYWICI